MDILKSKNRNSHSIMKVVKYNYKNIRHGSCVRLHFYLLQSESFRIESAYKKPFGIFTIPTIQRV